MSTLSHCINTSVIAASGGIIGRGVAASVFLLAIHHALSWWSPNFVLPIGLGVVGTMGLLMVSQSAYWVWHPWTWPMISGYVQGPAVRLPALALALGGGGVMLLFLGGLMAHRWHRT